ncbi:MAG: sulfatase, partial [Verrucomicrobia bacterium]|nr:sulfatase [Verrucomicrobiota bacterium]
GKTPAGSTSDELIELTDLLATCAAITGAKLSQGTGEDSRNILPYLLGEKKAGPIREYAIHHSLWGMFAIRKGDWKLVEGRGSGGFTRPRVIDAGKEGGPVGQLYNLKNDPSETKNLWEENSEIVKELTDLLEKVKGKDA